MAGPRTARNTDSGSPRDGEPEYLVVGSLRRAHGVRGEMVMEVITDFPDRLKAGVDVYVGSSYKPMMIEGARPHHEGLLVKFRGLKSREEAAHYRNQQVYVTAHNRPPLPQGQFYEHQILGFAVVEDASNQKLGTLSEIMHTGANDVYVVTRPNGSELLLPVITGVVLALDPGDRTIRVHLLPGLADDSGG